MSKRRSFNATRSGASACHGEFDHGPWHVEYRLNDGGRLNRLTYRGYDLLTAEPENFRPPASEHGRFEDRPVYGYDDCFPSVVACFYPGTQTSIPDHGEVCWLAWEVREESNGLTFSVESQLFPLTFERTMLFTDTAIIWKFSVKNNGNNPIAFQHSMHPLIKLDELKAIELPGFKSVFDWNKNRALDGMTPESLAGFLLGQPKGGVEMLFVQEVEKGEMTWTYRSGFRIRMRFPAEHFSTIGIWWDNDGYPAEDGIRRNECAFEPTPGKTSLLTQAYAEGNSLSVAPGERFSWQMSWEVERDLK